MDAIRFQARVLVSSLALIVTVAIHPGVVWGADATYVPGKSMWAAKRSNVRTGPGTSYRIVDLLEVGEQVGVVAKTGNWYQLEPQAGLPERFVYAPLLAQCALGFPGGRCPDKCRELEPVSSAASGFLTAGGSLPLGPIQLTK